VKITNRIAQNKRSIDVENVWLQVLTIDYGNDSIKNKTDETSSFITLILVVVVLVLCGQDPWAGQGTGTFMQPEGLPHTQPGDPGAMRSRAAGLRPWW
jgi:hypothetical protein